MTIPGGDYTVEDKEKSRDEGSFEERMLQRVTDDYANASQHRSGARMRTLEFRKQYRNARHYSEWRARKELPLPVAQELIDQFVAQLRQKMSDRPATVVGTPGTEQSEIDVIQELTDYQDYVDDIKEKMAVALRDIAVDGFTAAQVDFTEKHTDKWSIVEEEVDAPEDQTYLHRWRGVMPTKIKRTWKQVPVTTYMGPRVKVLDTLSVYWTQDKKELNDPHPIMVATDQPRDYFNSEPYFKNQDQIDEDETGAEVSVNMEDGEMPSANDPVAEPDGPTANNHHYIEWQGRVNRSELYKYSKDGQSPEGDEPKIDPNETVWAICGVVDKKTVVRLHQLRTGQDGPNLIIGCLQHDGSVFNAVGIMDMIYALCRSADRAGGMMETNIIQAIDAGWGIDVDRIRDKNPIVNTRNFILNTDGNPSEIIKRIDQPDMAEALFRLIAFYFEEAKKASRLTDITLGRGDPAAETLGESSMAESNSTTGLNDYLQTVEATFVRPLYQMRNAINVNLVDRAFVYAVVGDGALHWRDPVDPSKIRASVDFICESSTREANKGIVTAQMLKVLDLSSTLIAAGVGLDATEATRLLFRDGFGLSKEQIEMLLPLLKMKQAGGIDTSQLVAVASLLKLQQAAMMPGPVPIDSGGGGQGAIPLSEQEAQNNITQENQPISIREVV